MEVVVYTHGDKIMSFETPKLPEVKFNKTGFEIRTDILAMAKDMVAQEYSYKWHDWELSQEREEKTGRIINKVNMPVWPGVEEVLGVAEKMYAFVNNINASVTKKD